MKKGCLVVVALIVVLGAIAAILGPTETDGGPSGAEGPERPSRELEEQQPGDSEESQPPARFELSDQALEGIIQTMKGNGARDAAVAVKNGGKTVNLALQVDFGTSEAEAREMCENFLRQVAALSNDKNPGKEIGPGRFTYNVGAFTPDQKWVVQGAKARGARQITW